MKREPKKAFWHHGDDPRNDGFIPTGCFFPPLAETIGPAPRLCPSWKMAWKAGPYQFVCFPPRNPLKSLKTAKESGKRRRRGGLNWRIRRARRPRGNFPPRNLLKSLETEKDFRKRRRRRKGRVSREGVPTPHPAFGAVGSRWPPKPLRIAEMIFSA
jgi:hypothetical protein